MAFDDAFDKYSKMLDQENHIEDKIQQKTEVKDQVETSIQIPTKPALAYWVQLGSFKKQDRAYILADKATNAGFPSIVVDRVKEQMPELSPSIFSKKCPLTGWCGVAFVHNETPPMPV